MNGENIFVLKAFFLCICEVVIQPYTIGNTSAEWFMGLLLSFLLEFVKLIEASQEMNTKIFVIQLDIRSL